MISTTTETKDTYISKTMKDRIKIQIQPQINLLVDLQWTAVRRGDVYMGLGW